MRAGTLRHRVTVEAPVDVGDGQGGTTRTWEPVVDAWASVRPLDSKEVFFAGQNFPGATHSVRMRASGDVKLTSRLAFGDRLLYVSSLRDLDERGEEIALLCEEKQS